MSGVMVVDGDTAQRVEQAELERLEAHEDLEAEAVRVGLRKAWNAASAMFAGNGQGWVATSPERVLLETAIAAADELLAALAPRMLATGAMSVERAIQEDLAVWDIVEAVVECYDWAKLPEDVREYAIREEIVRMQPTTRSGRILASTHD